MKKIVGLAMITAGLLVGGSMIAPPPARAAAGMRPGIMRDFMLVPQTATATMVSTGTQADRMNKFGTSPGCPVAGYFYYDTTADTVKACNNALSAVAVGTSITPLSIVDANTVAQSNTTNPQAFLVYATVDNVASPTNYERASLAYNAGQARFRLGSEKGGTGTLRSWDFAGGGGYGFLDSGGNRGFQISANIINAYNNLGTVAQGVPPIRGTQSLTAQNAAISATSVYASAPAGLFRVCYNAATTTSGTGTTATVSVIWTDAGGAKTFTSGTFALNAVDVTGQVNGCQIVRSAASQNIQISTAGTFGTSVYRVDATVEALQ